MKDRILKLCKRLDKFTFDEILSIADDIDESVLKLMLQTLEHEHYLKQDNSNYIYIKRHSSKRQCSRLPLFFQFHSNETIDFMIKGFCADVEAAKMMDIFGITKHVIHNFNQYFRATIYEKQKSELLKYFARKPKLPQERVYMNNIVYLYLIELQNLHKRVNLKFQMYSILIIKKFFQVMKDLVVSLEKKNLFLVSMDIFGLIL